MKEISVVSVQQAIKEMVQEINFYYPNDVLQALNEHLKTETNLNAQPTIRVLKENARIAGERKIPICQDTGMVIVYLKVGQDVHFIEGSIQDAIQQGIREGYQEGYLRMSIVNDPVFKRINTKDNTPGVIYTEIVEGEKVEIEVITKGFGSENMSKSIMLKPGEGVEGVKQFVIDTVKQAGPNACPPFVVGVGIGGTFDYAAYLSKKATLKQIGIHHEDENYRLLEIELLETINQLDIGPQGLGGKTTALNVAIESYPTHIAGLPVAVNISCHITRHAKRVIQ